MAENARSPDQSDRVYVQDPREVPDGLLLLLRSVQVYPARNPVHAYRCVLDHAEGSVCGYVLGNPESPAVLRPQKVLHETADQYRALLIEKGIL